MGQNLVSSSYDQVVSLQKKGQLTSKKIIQIAQQHLNKKYESKDLIKEDSSQESELSEHEYGRYQKLLENQLIFLSNSYGVILRTINQIMMTRQVFRIKQQFPNLIIQLLRLQQLSLYIVRLDGTIQLHTFSNNNIQQINSQDEIYCRIKSLIDNKEQINSNIILQLFSISYQPNQLSFILEDNGTTLIVKVTGIHKNKLIDENILKIVKNIIEISPTQNQLKIINIYSKMLIELLNIILKFNDKYIREQLVKQFPSSNINFIYEKILKKQKLYQLSQILTQYQEKFFNIQELLIYYRQKINKQTATFMDFDQSGQLLFISNNCNLQFCAQLRYLWLQNKLSISDIFANNTYIQQELKRCKKCKDFQQSKVQINQYLQLYVRSNQSLIQRVQVTITSDIMDGCLSNDNSTKIHSKQSSSGSNDSKKKIITLLQQENPGITSQGWINLFIKKQQPHRRNSHIIVDKVKNSRRSRSDQKQNNIYHELSMYSEINHIDIDSADVNLLQIHESMLQPICRQIFSRMTYLNRLNVNLQTLNNFISDIHCAYETHNNSFHNFIHGVNVMHTCYLLLSIPMNKIFLSSLKIFSTILSALCHDVGHTGRTNSFEIATQSQKAILYNDRSPLENHHSSLSFQILRKIGNNFLKEISSEQWNQIRNDVISNILYTDIKEHFSLLKKFKEISFGEKNIRNDEQSILTGMLVHCSDFGGSIKNFKISREWSAKINQQFTEQYHAQGQLGIQQTPFMKDLDSISILSKNQAGFLRVIVLPLYQSLNCIYMNDSKVLMFEQQIKKNIEEWKKIHQSQS